MKHWSTAILLCSLVTLTHAAPASPFAAAGMPYAAFDALPARLLKVPGGEIDVAFAPGKLDLPQARVLDWIASSAQAVSIYFGRFPVSYARILVIPGAGRGVHSGSSYGYDGAAIKLGLGRATRARDLARDWIMTHELVHLGFPTVPEAHNWIQEGISTYVEPIARAQAGQLSQEQVWGDLVDQLPQGLPKPGDQGLDHTPTWARTYWGGALFCLLADIEIRERTGNRFGLQDALRGIAQAGGNIEAKSSLARALKVGDEATGVPVLIELYERMKATPVATDLPALWRRLGVEVRGNTVIFHQDAELASVRRAIMSGAPMRSASADGALSRTKR